MLIQISLIPTDFKRYLLFGNNFNENVNSNRINSDKDFSQYQSCSEESASNLISQGYHVIEDFKLDFHNSTQGRCIKN